MRKIKFNVPIKERHINPDNPEEFLISGIAINETTTRNGVKYTAEELSKAAEGLNGKPILKDHENSVDNIVGKVREAGFSNGQVLFKGQIMDAKMKEMLEDGRINNVSIGAIIEDVSTEGDVIVAKGIEFLELSLVAVPGDPNATINGFATAVAESFKSKMEVKNMADEEVPKEEPKVEEPVEKPKEEEKPAEEPKEEEPTVADKEVEKYKSLNAEMKEYLKLKEEMSKIKETPTPVVDKTKGKVIKDEEVKSDGVNIVRKGSVIEFSMTPNSRGSYKEFVLPEVKKNGGI